MEITTSFVECLQLGHSVNAFLVKSRLLVGYSKFLKNTLPQDTAIYWNTVIINK